MDFRTLYIPQLTPALGYAREALSQAGISMVSRGEDAGCWLFPVPTREILRFPEPGTLVIGGKLDRPELSGFSRLDLLEDALYLAENARLTAECTLRILGERLQTSLLGCGILIIGWGRIGKCLTRLLRALEADLTVAARKETDRATAHALGYKSYTPDKCGQKQKKAVFHLSCFHYAVVPILEITVLFI